LASLERGFGLRDELDTSAKKGEITQQGLALQGFRGGQITVGNGSGCAPYEAGTILSHHAAFAPDERGENEAS